MAQIQIILDAESIAKLDACARVCKLSRAQMLKAAINAAARQCDLGGKNAWALEQEPEKKETPFTGVVSERA